MTPRLTLWTVAMAYAVFLMVSKGSVQIAPAVAVSAVVMGAASGFMLGAMFSRRALRRRAAGIRSGGTRGSSVLS